MARRHERGLPTADGARAGFRRATKSGSAALEISTKVTATAMGLHSSLSTTAEAAAAAAAASGNNNQLPVWFAPRVTRARRRREMQLHLLLLELRRALIAENTVKE